MSGVMTSTTDRLIRTNIWSTKLKETFEAELFCMKYVDMITDFPDGEVINIPSLGQAEVFDYEEGQAVRYTAFDTGNFVFSITAYKGSATYITKKMKQDSFYTARLEAAFVPKQHRAIMESMETDLLAIGPNGQTPNSLNTINSGNHRYVGSGTSSSMAPQDFAKALYALQKANVPQTNLVAIVDPSVAYTFSTMTNLVNLSFNKAWEGIVADGAVTGIQFKFNIFGFDVYVSNFLKKSVNETINGLSTTTGVANILFSTTGDANPFVGAIRQAPEVDSDYNKDFQRDEYVTTARYGFGLYRPEALVTVLTNEAVVS